MYRHGLAAQEQVDVFSGHGFGEKVALTVGSSYAIGALIGAAKGLYAGLPMVMKKMPMKLRFNNIFNLLGKNATLSGNAFGAAGFLYYLVASTITFINQDQLKDLDNVYRNMICGSITGAIYKSQRGVRGMFVGGMIGTLLLAGLTKATQFGNEKGWTSFEIRF